MGYHSSELHARGNRYRSAEDYLQSARSGTRRRRSFGGRRDYQVGATTGSSARAATINVSGTHPLTNGPLSMLQYCLEYHYTPALVAAAVSKIEEYEIEVVDNPIHVVLVNYNII